MSDQVTVVFVHGWAMNSAVWDDCIEQLPEWINVIVVDLPGHGTMANVEASALDDYVQALMPLVHVPVIWVGWSLGGLAVLRLAELYPERVAAAMLVSTNPCFVTKPGWDCAVDAEIFDQFASNLANDQEKTIRRFLALQVKGLPDAMVVVRQLQHSIEARGAASKQALISGLGMLLETDMRHVLGSIEAPLHWLLGAKDGLVPASLAEVLMREYDQQDVTLNAGASHAPFISHREDFLRQLVSVAQNLRK